jgi:hypothetical protein
VRRKRRIPAPAPVSPAHDASGLSRPDCGELRRLERLTPRRPPPLAAPRPHPALAPPDAQCDPPAMKPTPMFMVVVMGIALLLALLALLAGCALARRGDIGATPWWPSRVDAPSAVVALTNSAAVRSPQSAVAMA